ncbi:MAG: hypothetical protein WC608_05330 [Parcubacteria group bacterium]
MNKGKILKSVFVIVGAAAIAATVSYAVFQDQSKVLGTTFSSGDADLKIKMPDNGCVEWSDNCSGVSWSGIYPGWNQSYNLYLKNVSGSPIILQIVPVIEETASSQELWDNTYMEIVCTGHNSTGRYSLTAWKSNAAVEIDPRLSQNEEAGPCEVKFDIPEAVGNEIANSSIGFDLVLNANQVGEGTVAGDETCVPETEVCDGQDNDCDEATDEGGVCGLAESSCADGTDNDDDGAIDCQDPGCFYNSQDCVAPVCGDGTCRTPLETYTNCPSDCASLAPTPECTNDNDCNNDKPCTMDTCVNGSCVHTPNNNTCAAYAINSCLISTCVGASGDMWGCAYQATTPGASCTNLTCLMGGNCNGWTCNSSGACLAPAQTPPAGCGNCDDSNSCTNDGCVGNVCQHTSIVLGQCIFGGTCTGGVATCNPNPNCPNNCDDDNACTTDTCNIFGCTNTATPNTLNCGNSAGEYCDQTTGQHYCECYLALLNYPNCSITIPTWPF